MTRTSLLSLLSLFVLCTTAPLLPAQTLFNVSINTSGLNGVSGGLAFDFIGGDSVDGNNAAIISGLSGDPTLVGSTTNTGSASGSLPGNVTLRDSGFSESFRGITFGNTLGFTLSLTNNFAAPGSPDEFSFFLTDPTNTNTLVHTDDPTGADALFTLDANGVGPAALTVFTPSTPGVSLSVRAVTPGVPEPRPLAFAGAGLFVGALLLRSLLRRR